MRKTALFMLFGLVLNLAGIGYAQSTNSGTSGFGDGLNGGVGSGRHGHGVERHTGISKNYVTNQDGLYDTSSIVAGSYTLTFTSKGSTRSFAGR